MSNFDEASTIISTYRSAGYTHLCGSFQSRGGAGGGRVVDDEWRHTAGRECRGGWRQGVVLAVLRMRHPAVVAVDLAGVDVVALDPVPGDVGPGPCGALARDGRAGDVAARGRLDVALLRPGPGPRLLLAGARPGAAGQVAGHLGRLPPSLLFILTKRRTLYLDLRLQRSCWSGGTSTFQAGVPPPLWAQVWDGGFKLTRPSCKSSTSRYRYTYTLIK